MSGRATFEEALFRLSLGLISAAISIGLIILIALVFA